MTETPILTARGITKSFGGRAVLRGIDLDAHRGDVITVLGGSGSGKSTFLRCLNLLELPDAGTITIAGTPAPLLHRAGHAPRVSDTRALGLLRRKTAMVFQNFNLWAHMSVLDNVTAAPIHVHGQPRAEAEARAHDLLAKVGMAGFEHHWPRQLSGGQQQRVAIARALATDPELMLFDEPTSALDPERVREVLDLMRALAGEGRTMIIVTHEMAFARDVSTRVVHVREGVIESMGPPGVMFGPGASAAFRAFCAG